VVAMVVVVGAVVVVAMVVVVTMVVVVGTVVVVAIVVVVGAVVVVAMVVVVSMVVVVGAVVVVAIVVVVGAVVVVAMVVVVSMVVVVGAVVDVVCGTVVVVGPPAHASQQLAVWPTDAEPPSGARQRPALLRMLQWLLPSMSVRQHVTNPLRPQVERAAQASTSVRQILRRPPLRTASLIARTTQETYWPWL